MVVPTEIHLVTPAHHAPALHHHSILTISKETSPFQNKIVSNLNGLSTKKEAFETKLSNAMPASLSPHINLPWQFTLSQLTNEDIFTHSRHQNFWLIKFAKHLEKCQYKWFSQGIYEKECIHVRNVFTLWRLWRVGVSFVLSHLLCKQILLLLPAFSNKNNLLYWTTRC